MNEDYNSRIRGYDPLSEETTIPPSLVERLVLEVCGEEAKELCDLVVASTKAGVTVGELMSDIVNVGMMAYLTIEPDESGASRTGYEAECLELPFELYGTQARGFHELSTAAARLGTSKKELVARIYRLGVKLSKEAERRKMLPLDYLAWYKDHVRVALQ